MRPLLNRLSRPVALLIVAAQLLLAIPSLAHASLAAGSTTPCNVIQMSGQHQDGCPCCPDGVSSMKDCLVTCSMAVAVTSAIGSFKVSASHDAPVADVTDPISYLADPPLKPPPIA